MKILKAVLAPFIGVSVLFIFMVMVLLAPVSETPFNGWNNEK